jgi:hypothetical protein
MKIAWWVAMSLWPGLLWACPSGYESQAALVKAARLIVGVEVESVTDVAQLKGEEGNAEPLFDRNDENHGRAEVKVTECLRGTCDVKRFTLTGGPYATCAPGANYLSFEPRQKLFLLLDRPLPADVRNVVITWRCRVFDGERTELLDLIRSTKDGWSRAAAAHRKLFPDAMLRAAALLPAFHDAKPLELPQAETYATLACLRLLLCDPDHLRPAECGAPQPGSLDLLGASTRPDEPGDHRTAGRTTVWQSAALDEAIKRRAAARSKEVAAFNRPWLLDCLTRELGVDSKVAGRIADDDAVAEYLKKVQPSPLSFDLDLRNEERLAKSVRSASLLLAIADDEDDRLVWRTFGMEPDEERQTLDAGIFLPYLAKHPEQFDGSWGRIQVLLALDDRRVVPQVKKIMRQTGNDSRLVAFFKFFARQHEDEACLATLDRLGELVTEGLAQIPDAKDRESARGFIGYLVEECRKAAAKYGRKSPELTERLKTLGAKYPVKDQSPIGA